MTTVAAGGASPATTYLQHWAARVDRELLRRVPETDGDASRLWEAMRYTLEAGGKRLRPVLLLAACEASGGSVEEALGPACAVEMIHTYSLIHDDLPAMDDDDLRRGRPTAHRRFDEATAVLAGDGLLTLAFEVLALELPPERAADGIALLAAAAGPSGMVGGQMADLLRGAGKGTEPVVREIHRKKTAVLIAACVEIGGLVAGASPETRTGLRAYGERVGLAFQIADDLLDLESTSARMGKPTQRDAAENRLTYPAAVGAAAARTRAAALVAEAKGALAAFGERAATLAALADFAVGRRS